MTGESGALRLHASAVALGDDGVLITGAAGAGKSTLALELIAMGALLISDDQTEITPGNPPMLNASAAIAGQLEIRGVGIVDLAYRNRVPLRLIVDLDGAEATRLPESHFRDLLDHPVRVIFARDLPARAAIVMTVLKGQIRDPDDPIVRQH